MSSLNLLVKREIKKENRYLWGWTVSAADAAIETNLEKIPT